MNDTSGYRRAREDEGGRPMPQGSKPWYDRTWVVVLALFLFYPVGLYALYKNRLMNTGVKVAIAGVTFMIFMATLAG